MIESKNGFIGSLNKKTSTLENNLSELIKIVNELKEQYLNSINQLDEKIKIFDNKIIEIDNKIKEVNDTIDNIINN